MNLLSPTIKHYFAAFSRKDEQKMPNLKAWGKWGESTLGMN